MNSTMTTRKLIMAAVIIAVVSFLLGTQFSTKSASQVASDQKVDISKAKAKQTLNKTYEFPINDDKGKQISKLKYVIENAALQDQVIVKAQPYNAVKGKTFLVLSIKLTNDFKQAIQINSRDYVRLSVNGSKEYLAPEIHSDPVQVQAISAKQTRVGFTIDENYKTLVLYVGEIDGKKDAIKLVLR